LEENSELMKENAMDEHRVTGAARNVGGRVEEKFGRVTGDTKSQVQGVIDQAQGTAENLYGQAKDAASSAAEGVRKTASSFEDIFRRTIEDKPYTAIAIALGLGWLIGRTHRPL
jgi:uncharacterized protein YjbJ (UPF0337 family)